MLMIAVTDETWELCTALLGDTPVVHGTETFVIFGKDFAPEQIFAWELERYLPANDTRQVTVEIFHTKEK